MGCPYLKKSFRLILEQVEVALLYAGGGGGGGQLQQPRARPQLQRLVQSGHPGFSENRDRKKILTKRGSGTRLALEHAH
jgi:hypothetical protein